ncbi:MAG: preprotein translocase subunit SecE [Sphingobacteriales bacterium]|jgi:preprotein translocase subunit SecE|nr:preprotein translocase subunit SecE [Sphingobacteriales bacterium]
MSKFLQHLKDSYKELVNKVTWPNWEQLQQSTMIVLVATIILAVILWLMDFIAGGALNFLYKMLYS